jgi:hypothetical protein
MQRYPVVGGAAAWRLPVLTALLALGGLTLDSWALVGGVVVLGWGGHRLWRSVVIELSPDGLARGLRLEGVFVGPTASMSWTAVVAVETDWWEPDDHHALETQVRSRDGTVIRLSTAMGLRSYWACLHEIVRNTPRAVRSGLTDATLASGPPAGRDLLPVKAAGGLALILGAMLGLGYVLAQGRSSLSRYLEESATPPSSAVEACRPSVGIEGVPPTRCEPRTGDERPPAP